MPVRMMNFVTAPPPAKNGKGYIKKTEEWNDFCIALGAGLKPQEYITIEFIETHEIFRHVKYPLEIFLAQAKKKIEELRLPYDCYIRNKILYCVGRGVIS